MKCQRCGKEYERNFCLCPQCFCEPIKKDRIWTKIWEVLWQISVLLIAIFAAIGIDCIFGKYWLLPTSILFFLLIFSVSKRKERSKKVLHTKISKILSEPSFNSVDWFKKDEILKEIKESNKI